MWTVFADRQVPATINLLVTPTLLYDIVGLPRSTHSLLVEIQGDLRADATVSPGTQFQLFGNSGAGERIVDLVTVPQYKVTPRTSAYVRMLVHLAGHWKGSGTGSGPAGWAFAWSNFHTEGEAFNNRFAGEFSNHSDFPLTGDLALTRDMLAGTYSPLRVRALVASAASTPRITIERLRIYRA